MLKIYSIKTKDKIYISAEPKIKSYGNSSGLSNYFFNGKKAEPSFHTNWLYVTEEIKRVYEISKSRSICKRYVLKDKTLISDKIPEFLNIIDVEDLDSDNGWSEKYAMFKSLYEMEYETIPEKEIDVEFEIEEIMSIDSINEPYKFKYVTENKIIHQLIDEIFYPSLIISQKPCKISSSDSYTLVRNYIKTHIDHKVSRITSDFNFCFTVKKIIPIAKPYDFRSDVSKFNSRKPKYELRRIETKEVEIFEMTYRPECYKGYTPIEEFIGENEEDLELKIEQYLDKLIKYINEPIIECTHCIGSGYLFDTGFNKNER